MAQVKHWLADIEKILCVVLLVLISSLMAINVIMLTIAGTALSWASEVVLTGFVFFIWLGISYGFKERKHIRVTAVTELLPEKARLYLALLVDALVLVFFLVVFFVGIQWMMHPSVAVETSLLLRYPMWMLYASAPLGAALSTIRIIQNFVRDIRILRIERGTV